MNGESGACQAEQTQSPASVRVAIRCRRFGQARPSWGSAIPVQRAAPAQPASSRFCLPAAGFEPAVSSHAQSGKAQHRFPSSSAGAQRRAPRTVPGPAPQTRRATAPALAPCRLPSQLFRIRRLAIPAPAPHPYLQSPVPLHLGLRAAARRSDVLLRSPLPITAGNTMSAPTRRPRSFRAKKATTRASWPTRVETGVGPPGVEARQRGRKVAPHGS